MRRPAIFFIAISVLVCVVDASAQTRVPETDTQVWNDIQVTIPLSKRTEFVIIGTARIGGDVTKFVDERFGFRVNYLLEKHVTLQAVYFHREGRPPNGNHEREDRIAFGAAVRKPLGKFTLSSRNWFERRWRDPQVDAWRYRNRIQLEHPFQIGKTKLNWMISDEFFYDWSLGDLHRNRFSVGVSRSFNKHFTLELYVMRQNDGRSRPGDLTILGSLFRVKL